MKPASWALAKDVIVAALRLPLDERESFVSSQVLDPELRARIQTLVASTATVDDLDRLDEVDLAETSGLTFDDLDGDGEELSPGSHVGKYVVMQLIGRGGMSQVYLGRDPLLRRNVALKCLTSTGIDPTRRRAQILHEARAAARVEHTNVAIIHDVLEDTGRAFIVMEFVAGESLASRLKRQRLSVDDVMSIGLQLTAALGAAHAKGVVHRDLKPGNVQFTTDGVAKVLDFGIAHAARAATTVATDATTRIAGLARLVQPTRLERAGTPQYMSPEQLLCVDVDQRSDLYSLGLILFEMATGRRMHPTDDLVAIAEAHRKGASRIDEIGPNIPRPLAEIIRKALESDVTRRYQSAAELEAALRLVVRSQSTSQVSRGELIRQWAVRLALAVPLAIVIIAALGWLKTSGFNHAFGRTGPFARFGAEPWIDYLRWGLRGNIARIVVAGGFIVLAAGVRALIGMLNLIPPVGRAARNVTQVATRFVEATGLRHPGRLAQALAALGMVMLAGIAWLHADLVQATTASFNSAPLAILLPMSEEAPERNIYQNELTVVVGLLGFALHKVLQLRSREQTSAGRGGVVALLGVTAFAVVMTDLPYRTFRYRDFERADLGGRHCYITGEAGDELLVLCPADAPPRSRVVSKNDSTLKRLGTLENVFRGFPSTP